MDFTANKRTSSKQLTIIFLTFCYFTFITRECKSQETNRCTSKETCGTCIGEDPKCVWCGQQDYTEKRISRCDFIENHQEKNCSDVINPRNSIRTITDFALSEKGAKPPNLVQIKPQQIEIKLRPNFPQKFSVKFRQAEDYPVDLYYLMDLSFTMLDDKENLARLSATLATEMQRLTSNFRLGFGSFVEKVALPYSNVHTDAPKKACRNTCAPAVKTYSFLNHMSLSSSIQEFTGKVRDSDISTNVDRPEGTLEAVMQAIVCKERIGWREHSRKLLVVVTDAGFHIAGDGKMGGIIKPNDGKCHLNNEGYYTWSTENDYPSVSQLNRKVKENNINLIFAVVKKQEEDYKSLSRRLVGSTAAELAGDSSNIVQLIKDQYDAITSSVEMTDSSRESDNIEVTYESYCLDGERKETGVCRGIRPGNTVEFSVTLKFSKCPDNRKEWTKDIEIYPIGLNEKLVVVMKMICECNCAKSPQEDAENRGIFCSGRGNYECGVCNCDSGYGTTCECEENGNKTTEDNSGCKKRNEDMLCSNRGQCECGKCKCDGRYNPGEKIYGTYCECSNFECDRINKKMCNGRGTCDCGICKCDKGWKGKDCDCSEYTGNCVADNSADICSGHGICFCGSCKCDETYYGKFCDDCLSCSAKCEEYSICVRCDSDNHPQEELKECELCRAKNVNITLVDKVEVAEAEKEKGCSIQDEQGCSILFKYRMEENSPIIHLQRERDCPVRLNAAVVASGTAVGVVAAGIIALLIWKLATTVHDRNEYAKFQKDLEVANWDAGKNPIFIEPSTTFANPSFGGQ